MAINNNGQFEYPERGWSQGRIRKRGQRPDDEVQVAMMKRKGEAEIGGWGAEAEKFIAGSAARGRGGVTKGAEGLSPDVIAQHKAQIEAMGQQWQMGAIDWQKFHREVKGRGWDLLWLPLDAVPSPATASVRQFLLQDARRTLANPRKEGEPAQTAHQAFIDAVLEGKKPRLADFFEDAKKRNSIGLVDPNGKKYEVPLTRAEE